MSDKLFRRQVPPAKIIARFLFLFFWQSEGEKKEKIETISASICFNQTREKKLSLRIFFLSMSTLIVCALLWVSFALFVGDAELGHRFSDRIWFYSFKGFFREENLQVNVLRISLMKRK